jgi:hypothetical protein
MIQGARVYNNDNQVLISSDIENMHYGGQATHTGVSSGLGTFPSYAGSSSSLIEGRCIHTYTFTSAGEPLVFIRPDNYNLWHSVIQQSQNGSTWTFKVLQSGTTSQPPEIHVFVRPSQLPHSTETKGLQVFLDDGTPAFDSRLKPLAIADGGVSQPPSDPTNGSGLPGETGVIGSSYTAYYANGCSAVTRWNQGTMAAWGGTGNGDTPLDHDFSCSNRYLSNALSTTSTYSNLMFAAPSLAQSVQQRLIRGYKEDENNDAYYYGCCLCQYYANGQWYWVSYYGGFYIDSIQRHYSTASWWVMYRNSFRLRSGYIDSGWGTYDAGYSYSSSWEDAGWGGSGGNINTGTLPYTPKTINLQDNAYLIADVTRYT